MKRLLWLVLLVGCLDASAATSGVTTKQIRTAAPTNGVDLTAGAATEGSSLSVMRADAQLTVKGVLGEPNGGTGAGALTCSASQVLTSNGTAYSCVVPTPTVVADAPLSGSGTSASHLILADTAVTPASYGSASLVPSFTVDSKGRLTAAASNTASLPASAISSGTFGDARLTDAYSGTGACAANSWASTLNRDAAPTCTQPAFSNISGTAVAGQIPNLDASKITTGTLTEARGGTGAGALTCAAGDFITSNGTLYSCATPSSSGAITNQHVESNATVNCLSTGSTLATLTMAAGTYSVTASVGAQPSGVAAGVEADIKNNGAAVTGGSVFFIDNGGGLGPSSGSISDTVVVTFALNDSLTLTCSDTSGTGHAAGWSLVAFRLQ